MSDAEMAKPAAIREHSLVQSVLMPVAGTGMVVANWQLFHGEGLGLPLLDHSWWWLVVRSALGLWLIVSGLSGLLQFYSVAPTGVAYMVGTSARWSMPWSEYAGWRWLRNEELAGRHPVGPELGSTPMHLLILRTGGGQQRLPFRARRLSGGLAVPDGNTERLLKALWQLGPHVGQGWSETVGYATEIAKEAGTQRLGE